MPVEAIPERGGGMPSLSETKQSILIVDDTPENIPLAGRITAIADVFDALTSKRPYKDAWPIEKGVDFVTQESGTHFDPGLIPPFFDILPRIVLLRQQYDDAECKAPEDGPEKGMALTTQEKRLHHKADLERV